MATRYRLYVDNGNMNIISPILSVHGLDCSLLPTRRCVESGLSWPGTLIEIVDVKDHGVSDKLALAIADLKSKLGLAGLLLTVERTEARMM